MYEYGNRTVFKVKNDAEGNDFISMLRMHLNRKHYTIRVRGRHSNRKFALQERYIFGRENDIPAYMAESFGIYIKKKKIS